MINENDKKRLEELDQMIEELKKEKVKINPYSTLIDINMKQFGEQVGETHVLEKCPSFIRKNEPGWDFWSDKLGKVEVKSTRISRYEATININQAHPHDCDWFLVVGFDCINYEDWIFLIPSSDLVPILGATSQHDRKTGECYNFSCPAYNKTTRETKRSKLEKYRISSWEELNKILEG